MKIIMHDSNTLTESGVLALRCRIPRAASRVLFNAIVKDPKTKMVKIRKYINLMINETIYHTKEIEDLSNTIDNEEFVLDSNQIEFISDHYNPIRVMANAVYNLCEVRDIDDIEIQELVNKLWIAYNLVERLRKRNKVLSKYIGSRTKEKYMEKIIKKANNR